MCLSGHKDEQRGAGPVEDLSPIQEIHGSDSAIDPAPLLAARMAWLGETATLDFISNHRFADWPPGRDYRANNRTPPRFALDRKELFQSCGNRTSSAIPCRPHPRPLTGHIRCRCAVFGLQYSWRSPPLSSGVSFCLVMIIIYTGWPSITWPDASL